MPPPLRLFVRFVPMRTNKRRGGGTPRTEAARLLYSIPRACEATRMALLAKMQDGEPVVDDLAMSEPKTEDMAIVLKACNWGETSCLIGTAGIQPAI